MENLVTNYIDRQREMWQGSSDKLMIKYTILLTEFNLKLNFLFEVQVGIQNIFTTCRILNISPDY